MIKERVKIPGRHDGCNLEVRLVDVYGEPAIDIAINDARVGGMMDRLTIDNARYLAEVLLRLTRNP